VSGWQTDPKLTLYFALSFFSPSSFLLVLSDLLSSTSLCIYYRLEGCLLSCPSVLDAAVIGVWSEEQATELPRAYIVPSPDVDKDKAAEDARKWIESKLSNTKRLRGGVFILEAIPKSPSGKILRKDLRALAAKEGQKSKL